jgi:PAS domain S-box-containing protein
MPLSFAEQQLAAIVESSDDAIVGKDLASTITSWNRGAERLFGYTALEAIGQSIRIIIPAERYSEEDCVMERIRAGRHVETFETERCRKDGSMIEVSITVSPIRDGSGAIVGASKIARAITEQKRARREAQDARDRLAFLADVGAVLSSSLDYGRTLERSVHLALPRLGDYCNVLLLDEAGVLRHVAAGHVDRAKDEVVHLLAKQVLESDERPPVPTFASAVLKARKTMIVSHEDLVRYAATVDMSAIAPELRALAEQLAPWAYMGTPLVVLGHPAGVISVGTTETESRREYTLDDAALLEEFARRASAAIENARLFRQIEDLGRLKDEFLATLSHELRTPLSAILGWARMLANGQLDAERSQQAVNAILRNARAQSQLVDDVLDVARGMAGNLRLQLEPMDLVLPAHRGLEAIAPTAAAKRIRVELTAPAPVPVVGDESRMQQVVWNLLSNAVKFTPIDGNITIAVAAVDGTAELTVTDTGAGISLAFLPFVFDKFRQADASATRSHGGLGLGLAIARHLTEMHGGTIEAHSDGEGRGATFRVKLPLRTG